MQLEYLLDDLAKAKNVETAAAMDVCDRAQDLRVAEDRLKRADRRHDEAKDWTEKARAAVHRLIEAQTHSAFEDEMQ